MTVPLSPDEKERIERSFSKEVSREDIQRDVNSILGQMSEQEIQEAREELLHSLDPKLISFLMKRSQYKESMEPAVEMAPVIATEEEEAREVANSVDYSKIKTETDLDAAVALLPDAEKLKLEWTNPVTEKSTSNTPRFHFNGTLLPSKASSTISISSGLYNHGEEADRPGYTIEELTLLCRSAVTGQRVLALKCLYNILHRRSLARLCGQSLSPKELPISVLRTLTMLLERFNGAEEVFLSLRCLEELCTSPEELNRRLLLNLTYHGYEHAHLQDADAMRFVPDEDDEEEDEKDPYRRSNCSNLFTMLLEGGLMDRLFVLFLRFSAIPVVLGPAISLLRVLVESDPRFGEQIVNQSSLFTSLEKLCERYLNVSILGDSLKTSGSHHSEESDLSQTESIPSLRLFYITHFPHSSLTISLHVLLLLEALVRHSRKNASNIVRSSVLPVLKQWLLFFDETNSKQSTSVEVNCLLEGVLSVWRLCLLYGLDIANIDPFLPHLVRISQFASLGNRILAWSFFEVSVVSKRNTSSTYFIDFCNTLVLLAVELLRDEKTPVPIIGAVTHFLGSYIDLINECREHWDISEETQSSIQNQIVQLGYVLMLHAKEWMKEMISYHHQIYAIWNTIPSKPNLQTEFINILPEVFTSTEERFLSLSDLCFAVIRVGLSGIQNSLQFATMLRDSGWLMDLQDFAIQDLWHEAHYCPHSISYSYLHRNMILAHVQAIMILHTILPLQKNRSSQRAQIWRAAWQTILSILPGDEYIALQLIIHVLLDPVSLKTYVENRSEEAALNFDLDTVTDLLIQQLGDGRIVEHSQSLHLPVFQDRESLQLLPFSIHPSLPLLSYWFVLPFLKLRFRKLGEEASSSPLVVASEHQAVALLEFVREMETCECNVWKEKDKAMRFYCLLHICLAGSEIVQSQAVNDILSHLLPIYLTSQKKGPCKEHSDCLNELDSLIPKEEMVNLLNKICECVVTEYYSCPIVFQFLQLFLFPCRDWNERVLLLNFFFDHSCCHILLSANSTLTTDSLVHDQVKEHGLTSAIRLYYKQYVASYQCIWEEKEEVMEMTLRYFEQVQERVHGGQFDLLVNGFLFQILHYIQKQLPRYGYFVRQLESLFPSLDIDSVLSIFYVCSIKLDDIGLNSRIILKAADRSRLFAMNSGMLLLFIYY
ncbi:RNA polymerase 2-associated protein [Blastocystis sp. subtype 4]|uniref:RNA polymerase 2-associated protein n=1 Tax=Blastocystis sp. subtype 4 TaxID=944170 RepID=UPI000711D0AA|nr:RNA polymerase 2-associated protein [Blastocystis sp. subtype 4]KNB44205.1 RNA polymerase 2-associated protein [Blastocystis sp. subtype 4]|eukprot:XP_014527648.1 RNA polymerase 2-associated protein [Blastocystis sp. subtype 4]